VLFLLQKCCFRYYRSFINGNMLRCTDVGTECTSIVTSVFFSYTSFKLKMCALQELIVTGIYYNHINSYEYAIQ
jgi:hypothetical protein